MEQSTVSHLKHPAAVLLLLAEPELPAILAGGHDARTHALVEETAHQIQIDFKVQKDYLFSSSTIKHWSLLTSYTW